VAYAETVYRAWLTNSSLSATNPVRTTAAFRQLNFWF